MEGFVSVVSIYKDFGESAFCFWIIKVQGSSQKSEKEAQRGLDSTRRIRNRSTHGGAQWVYSRESEKHSPFLLLIIVQFSTQAAVNLLLFYPV